jgi:2-succinyl-5-enolpyruvyl-6-hydroxy-3-cyclohexene-1-carboxylate synthase
MPYYDLQTEWAEVVLGAFRSAGVTQVVVSPGSRSTPFVLAALRVPDLMVTDVVDERSAAFFALGQARVTGRPSLCLCTSGTAGAHYLPAVIEAQLTSTPLLVMTADRPLELQACSAAQTIDQVKLFGDHVQAFVELGAADSAPATLRATRRAVAQAVVAARTGPVHLNVRARKPLEPQVAQTADEVAVAHRVRAEAARPLVQALGSEPVVLAEAALDQVAEACRSSVKGLIVCGPAGPRQAPRAADVTELARRTGYPVLAEAASQLRFAGLGDELIDGFDWPLQVDDFARAHAPEVILQLGAPPTSSAWERFVERHTGTRRYVIAGSAWADPSGRAVAVAQADVGRTVRALVERLSHGDLRVPIDDEWIARWSQANAVTWATVSSLLERTGPLSEAQAVRTTIAHVRPESLLMLGNSLAIREVDAFCPKGIARCEVLSQRGASGIDGLVSGAAGAASMGRPTLLLLGDVSLLHDLGGLHVASKVPAPLAIVVLNNGGGRIFEQLPIGGSGSGETTPARALDHFTTPHTLDFGHAAALFDLPYRRAETLSELEQALAQANAHQGATLVEVRVAPRDAAETAGALRASIAQALARAGLTMEAA